MSKTKKQPVKQRIKDIALWGALFLIMSLLYGDPVVLKINVPLFLIIAAVLSTGRYKHGKADRIDPSVLQDFRRPHHSGFKTLASRQIHRGY